MASYQYRKSHCGDKTILQPSYLHNGISYTGKMPSLYWIRAQVPQNLRAFNPLWCWEWNIQGELGQYHGFWCPGSLHCQVISNFDIDYGGYTCPWSTQGRISIICVEVDTKIIMLSFLEKKNQHIKNFMPFSDKKNHHLKALKSWQLTAETV